MNRHIRAEAEGDRAAVFDVNAAAFPTQAEARLVDKLRDSVAEYISLVATEDGDIVGHIMFTPVTLDSCDTLRIMGLAPMAVSPSLQRCGVGSELVRAGLQHCRDLQSGAVAVLGHPEFYPRFGFRPSSKWRISSQYDVPAEVFMMTELVPDYLESHQGVIHYNSAFANV